MLIFEESRGGGGGKCEGEGGGGTKKDFLDGGEGMEFCRTTYWAVEEVWMTRGIVHHPRK